MKPRLTYLLLLSGVGCGARSEIAFLGEQGLGGGGGTSSTSTASQSVSSGAGGNSGRCTQFQLDGEPFAMPFNMNATEPQLGRIGDSNYLAFLAQDGSLMVDASLTPSSVWPHPFTETAPLVPQTTAFVAASGADGPVALVKDESSWFQLRQVPRGFSIPLFPSSGSPHRVARAKGRSLVVFEEGSWLQVATVRDDGLIVSEEPELCVLPPLLGRAVPTGSAFVGAFADSSAPGQSCFSQVPQPGLTLVTMLYEEGAPAQLREALLQTEPLRHLEMAPASFGSWLVFQTDGSTSLTMPPFAAYKIAPDGLRLPDSDLPLTVSASGIESPTLAVASMDDALVIAWVDLIDPSSPCVVVQRIEADGSAGPSASFSTGAAWLTGNLEMTVSADARSLVLAWTADVDKTVGVAKIHCLD